MVGMKEVFSNRRIGDISMDLVPLSDKEIANFSLQDGDLLFARQSLVFEGAGKCCIVIKPKSTEVFESHLIRVRIDRAKALPEYIFYYFNSYRGRKQIESITEQVSAAGIRGKDLIRLPILLPDLETQKKIVKILSTLDQKIELNNQQNETLFELGRQLYIEKFENDETVDKVELGNFFPVVTGKKDANASSENGKYPFFTCSKTISKIDDYVFDAGAILLAGNGDFNVKFYRGKFDAYQRTYVLIPNNPEYLGFLYWAISYNLPKITANYRGSVIKFITKGNIENFKIPFADNKYIPAFMKYLERIEKNNQQNKVLAGLRDALLPKLMSGEINLNEATINE